MAARRSQRRTDRKERRKGKSERANRTKRMKRERERENGGGDPVVVRVLIRSCLSGVRHQTHRWLDGVAPSASDQSAPIKDSAVKLGIWKPGKGKSKLGNGAVTSRHRVAGRARRRFGSNESAAWPAPPWPKIKRASWQSQKKLKAGRTANQQPPVFCVFILVSLRSARVVANETKDNVVDRQKEIEKSI